MKKGLMILTLIFLSLTLVSATYECSDGSKIILDQDEIEFEKRSSINGLGIGLLDSDETPAFGRYSVELLIDSIRLSLTNITEEEVNLKIGTYTISLINATDNQATIKVESISKSIEEQETEKIDDLQVYLINSDKTDTEETTTILAGSITKTLVSDQNPQEIISINNTEYLLELFSASDSNAIIKVSTCESGDITEIENTTPSTNNTDQTNSTIKNEGITNNNQINTTISTKTKNNSTENQEQQNAQTTEDDSASKEEESSKKTSILVIAISATLIIIGTIILFSLLKNKTQYKEV